MRRATLLVAVLVVALAGASIGGAGVGWDRPPIGAATSSVGGQPIRGGERAGHGGAPLAPSVVSAARDATSGATLDLLVSLDRPAGAELKGRLAELGTWSWTFTHVPVAAIRLPARRLATLQALPGVRAVHQEERLPYLLDDTARAMDARRAWDDLGITGAGVTVAVIDSGVDFTHPDLAPAFRANFKMTGFGEGHPVPVPLLAAPDTDLTSGHGTHVAGDVAGRGTASEGKYRGMAPGAGLVGLAAGDGLSISLFAVMEAYDWLVQHHEAYGIRVVNNSYGGSFAPFDPDDPINQATKAAADAGLVVVFAYGNDGGEMTANDAATAPWVIGVAAGTKGGGLAEFSSGGIEVDEMGTDFGGTDVVGEIRRPLAMGLYHPAVVATGTDVVSTRAAGAPLPLLFAADDVALPPEEAVRYTHASGTSMASPVAAGVAALVLEANPALGPEEVRHLLQVTARPIPGTPFHRQGYGYLDAAAAVDLARALRPLPVADATRQLAERQTARDTAVLGALAHPSHTWAWARTIPAEGNAVVHSVEVPAGTSRIKVVTSPLSFLPAGAERRLRILDADGVEVGFTGHTLASRQTLALDFDLRHLDHSFGAHPRPYDDLAFGHWSIRFEAPDPFELATVAAIFDDQQPDPCDLTLATPLTLRLQDDTVAGLGPYPADPTFTYVGPLRGGTLGTRAPERRLAGTLSERSGDLTGQPLFLGAPLPSPRTIAGDGEADLWLQRTVAPLRGELQAALLDVAPTGSARVISEGAAALAPGAITTGSIILPLRIPTAYTVPAGHRIGLRLNILSAGPGDMLLYDSDRYPSGLNLTAGTLPPGCPTALSPEANPPLAQLPASSAPARGQSQPFPGVRDHRKAPATTDQLWLPSTFGVTSQRAKETDVGASVLGLGEVYLGFDASSSNYWRSKSWHEHPAAARHSVSDAIHYGFISL